MSEHLSEDFNAHSPNQLSVPPEALRRSVALLRALNHDLRRRILQLLYTREPLTVTNIFVELRVEQSVVSQHLAILRKAQFVRAERDGKYIHYTLDRSRLSTVAELIRQLGT